MNNNDFDFPKDNNFEDDLVDESEYENNNYQNNNYQQNDDHRNLKYDFMHDFEEHKEVANKLAKSREFKGNVRSLYLKTSWINYTYALLAFAFFLIIIIYAIMISNQNALSAAYCILSLTIIVPTLILVTWIIGLFAIMDVVYFQKWEHQFKGLQILLILGVFLIIPTLVASISTRKILNKWNDLFSKSPKLY